jgi:hypothetical protein
VVDALFLFLEIEMPVKYEISIDAINYDQLSRLLILAWRGAPLEAVPVMQQPRPPSLRSAREADPPSATLQRKLRR